MKQSVSNKMFLFSISSTQLIKRRVECLDGVTIDLLVLNSLQYYNDIRRFWENFRRAYRILVQVSGLRVFLSRETGIIYVNK